MKNVRCCWVVGLMVLTIATSGFAQKIKIGYDKSVDFSKYKTYTWMKPDFPPTRPELYQIVTSSIDDELRDKGLTKVDANGDLSLSASGGIGFGYNTPAWANQNFGVWAGETPILLAPQVGEGSLTLQFLDRSQNKLVWSGTALQNLDPDQKEKSLNLVIKAIIKLLKPFPPKHS